MMRRKIVALRAPSDAAASSISRSSSISTGCTERITNGSVTNSSASRTAACVKATSIPTGLLRPVERQQREAGDDRRQRERQVDQRVDDALAAEAVAHQHPRDQRARRPR